MHAPPRSLRLRVGQEIDVRYRLPGARPAGALRERLWRLLSRAFLSVALLATWGWFVDGEPVAWAAVPLPVVWQDTPRAEEQSEAEFRSRVSELVDSLDGRRLATRQQAERELIQLGPKILPWLPERDGRFSAEARQRLRRVRRALEEQRAVQAAQASRFRLGSIASLREALTRITDKTGNRFHLGELPEQVIDVDLGAPQTFWIALDTVLDAADADVNPYQGEPGTLGIGPRREGRPSRTDAAAYAGVYRLEATSITARRNLHNAALSGLSVGTEIAWEPRLTPIGLSLPLGSVVAVMDDGQKLRPQEGEIPIATNPALPSADFVLPLPLPTGTPGKIETLTGRLRSMLPGANEHFQIPLSEPHEGETVGDVTVTLEQVRPNNNLHELRLEVAFGEAGAALESHRQWIFNNEVYVTDEAGDRKEVLGSQTYRQTANRVGIAYLFRLGDELEGLRMHYITPVSVVQEDIDFVLREIPLP